MNRQKQQTAASYESPALELHACSVEQGFTASDPWYHKGGDGDFSYETEDDETWG